MSGITRSTPSNSDSGNIIPASTTKISSPNPNAIMFIPNSPSPPRGITVSDCLLLLNEGFSPQPNFESYHTAPRLAPTWRPPSGGLEPPTLECGGSATAFTHQPRRQTLFSATH